MGAKCKFACRQARMPDRITNIARARGLVSDHHRAIQCCADVRGSRLMDMPQPVQTLKAYDRGGDFLEYRSAMSSALTAFRTCTKSRVWQPSP